MRVALFGGAFDPPHRAHRAVADACVAQLDLVRLIVLPSGEHPWKGATAGASAADRLALCRLAFAGMAKAEVSDFEQRRRGVAYTIDTLRAFRAELGPDARLYFLIGSDNLADLPRWRDAHTAMALAQFVTVPRAGVPIDAAALAKLDFTPTERQGLLAHVLRVTPSPLASTDLRARLAAGDDVTDALAPDVLAAIRRLHLYGT